jgi:type IV secretion system protein VirB10
MSESQVNSAALVDDPLPPNIEDIPSVNKKGTNDNKAGKAIFVIVVGAILIGALTWGAQRFAENKKASLKQSNAPKSQTDTAPIFNPEKTGAAPAAPKLGSESGEVPPSKKDGAQPAAPVGSADSSVRPLRGADGKPMVNAQGRAMGVDRNGNIIEVPAIALAGDAGGKKPLPSESAGAGGQAGAAGGQGGGQQAQKPPSRFGGSLFVGEPPKPVSGGDSASANQGGAIGAAGAQAAQVNEIMRQLGLNTGATGAGGRPSAIPPIPSSSATPFIGQPPGASLSDPVSPPRPGSVGASLFASATPVSLAKRFPDQNLVLPKGRQADCILTGRIVDETPGFTSCVLAQNLYGDNGRVLLLERGSELTGEYGTSNQLGTERLFVTWSRLKTPQGVEIDLSSPGADRLGTSGVPGQLDNRWGERIGAAFLISFVKDVTVAIIANQTKNNSGGGSTVNVTSGNPGQSTINAGSTIAEEVIKQTLKVRPRLTINEGDRISIYVARDLDFSPVYALRSNAAAQDVLRPSAK